MKYCTRCEQAKPLDDFGSHPRASDGKQSKCKSCYADYQRDRRKNPAKKAADAAIKKRSMAKRKSYYQRIHSDARRRRRQNPEYRAREYAKEKEWRDRTGANARLNHARRARKLAAQVSGPVPGPIYLQILKSGPCVYCGAPATTVDHITPLSRGGHEAEYNLVPACNPCNVRKGKKLLAEWDRARVTQALACSLKVCAQLNFQRPQLVLPPSPSPRALSVSASAGGPIPPPIMARKPSNDPTGLAASTP